jgi:hypothetical protein
MAKIGLCATIFTVVGKLTTLHAITKGLDVIDTPLDPFLATGATPSSNSHVSAACCHVPEHAATALRLLHNKVNFWNLADAVLDVGKACSSHFFYMFIYPFIIYHLEWIMHSTHDLSMLFIRCCSST